VSEDIGPAQVLAHQADEFDQHAVSRRVTETVIDRFEIVHVDEHEAEHRAIPHIVIQQPVEFLIEIVPAADTGQRIGAGQFKQFPVVLLQHALPVEQEDQQQPNHRQTFPDQRKVDRLIVLDRYPAVQNLLALALVQWKFRHR